MSRLAITFNNLDGIAMDHTKKPGDYSVEIVVLHSGGEMRETHSDHHWYLCGSRRHPHRAGIPTRTITEPSLIHFLATKMLGYPPQSPD
jgi:hypothetical protein